MIREALKNKMDVMIKSSPADLVTVTDQKVEKMLMSSIKEKYPYHRYFFCHFMVIKLSLGWSKCMHEANVSRPRVVTGDLT